ncbi:hypothetical protein KEJ44_03665 [Candidatus Bathyarchaeota archaeon]|nr:hypothetical protein [Candidatus Bathyarchaeota archaeon]
MNKLNARMIPLLAFLFLSSFSSSFFMLAPPACADRGVIPFSEVDVYGPGQKAILAWNGEVERLILSTDLYASGESRVLELLPLPSKPEVEGGSWESFEAVQSLVMKNIPRAAGEKGGVEGLSIVFHERIGAHEVTVVEASSLEDLAEFISKLAAEAGLPGGPSVSGKARIILEDYLGRGFRFWVLDVVDLTSNPGSVEPIIYEFRSPTLYYPLKISSTAEGSTEITLYLVTWMAVQEGDIPAGMRMARYHPSGQPVQFQVTHEELQAVDEGIPHLFNPVPAVYPSPTMWITAVKYEGELGSLDFDLEIPGRRGACRLIDVEVEKASYRLGEEVEVSVRFIHLLPGCVEIMVVHDHQVRLEILDSAGTRVESWTWNTEGDLYKRVGWKPSKEGVYLVRASSWWNGERLEVEDQAEVEVHPGTPAATSTTVTSITVTSIHADSLYEAKWMLIGAATAICSVLIGVAVAYWLLKPR